MSRLAGAQAHSGLLWAVAALFVPFYSCSFLLSNTFSLFVVQNAASATGTNLLSAPSIQAETRAVFWVGAVGQVGGALGYLATDLYFWFPIGAMC